MSVNSARLAPLLQAAARERQDLRLASFDERAVRWAVATGLGPLLYHVTRGDAERERSPLWPRVHSAYLSAGLVGAGQRDAIAEILDACAERDCTLTLLKGIAVAHRYYPESGLRPMRDIDVLAAESDIATVEAALTSLGYRQRAEAPSRFYETHHHTTPFFDERRSVWVEVHRRLVSSRPGRPVDDVLSVDHVAANLEPTDLVGRRAMRLTTDLELVYIATHWASRFQVVGGAIPLLDVIYLLKTTRPRWDRVLAWLDHAPVSASHLYAVVTYLARRDLVAAAPALIADLARRQRSFGAASLRIVHAMIDRFLLDGVGPDRVLSEDRLRIAWNTLFAPGRPSRNLAVLPWRMLPRAPRRAPPFD